MIIPELLPMLDSESFFSKAYYIDWLDWIITNREHNASACRLWQWMSAEQEYAANFIERYLNQNSPNATLVDLVCGTGQQLIYLLTQFPSLKGVGLDIHQTMIKRARLNADSNRMGNRVEFYIDDLGRLATLSDQSVELAICTGNTFGLIARLVEVLQSAGHFLLSVYANTAVATSTRIHSYRGVGLSITEEASKTKQRRALYQKRLRSASFKSYLTLIRRD